MKTIKIIAIIIVGTISVLLASHFTEKYVAEAAEKDKTLAEAIVQGQLQAEIQKAEEQAKEQLGDKLAVTDVELKGQESAVTTTPLVPETEYIELTTIPTETFTTVTLPTEKETEATTITEEIPEEIITEFTRGGLLPTDRKGIPLKTMFTISADEQNRVTKFLIDHYFLNGNVYVKQEARPELKEKKKLADDMEDNVITTLNLVLDSINMTDLASLMTADYGELRDEVVTLRDDFEKNYKNAYQHGELFGAMYDDSLAYFNRLIKALDRLAVAADEYAKTTNPLLAVGLLASTLDDVVIPEIMAVLEQSFDLVETSQEIFLEGTQGVKLLTRDEVKDIIINPALVLDTGLA
ncbi:MAG: hypothetical protein J6K17_09225 [Oscillospiraceae bacterium]|nr:hypothetical protein [Oscillospiraceae bacterium]